MNVRPLAIGGAWEITSSPYRDERGLLVEWYRAEPLEEAVGHRVCWAQANMVVSARGVIRGIHFADVPPGQAKYVMCPSGAALDVVIDIRVGSPTFGNWDAVRIDARDHRAVYLAEGLGHAVCALTDDTTVAYLCSTPYRPSAEHTIHPLDPTLAIDWPADRPVLSPRDAAAPHLADAAEQGLLPSYQECLKWIDERRVGSRV